MSPQTKPSNRLDEFDKANRNADLINTCELDDFDKLVVIQGWFHHFTKGQQGNLIVILKDQFKTENKPKSKWRFWVR